jgi:hypothetical protein
MGVLILWVLVVCVTLMRLERMGIVGELIALVCLRLLSESVRRGVVYAAHGVCVWVDVESVGLE